MCSVDWGLVVNAIAAAGSIGAATIALVIATRDRRDRKRERDAADEAQARLVLLEVEQSPGAPGYSVRVQNYGTQPILGVAVESAYKPGQPGWNWHEENEWLDVVKPDREALSGGTLRVRFVDADGNPLPKELEPDSHGERQFEDAGPSGPVVVIRFMDANGHYWTTGPFNDAERADPVSP